MEDAAAVEVVIATAAVAVEEEAAAMAIVAAVAEVAEEVAVEVSAVAVEVSAVEVSVGAEVEEVASRATAPDSEEVLAAAVHPEIDWLFRCAIVSRDWVFMRYRRALLSNFELILVAFWELPV